MASPLGGCIHFNYNDPNPHAAFNRETELFTTNAHVRIHAPVSNAPGVSKVVSEAVGRLTLYKTRQHPSQWAAGDIVGRIVLRSNETASSLFPRVQATGPREWILPIPCGPTTGEDYTGFDCALWRFFHRKEPAVASSMIIFDARELGITMSFFVMCRNETRALGFWRQLDALVQEVEEHHKRTAPNA